MGNLLECGKAGNQEIRQAKFCDPNHVQSSLGQNKGTSRNNSHCLYFFDVWESLINCLFDLYLRRVVCAGDPCPVLLAANPGADDEGGQKVAEGEGGAVRDQEEQAHEGRQEGLAGVAVLERGGGVVALVFFCFVVAAAVVFVFVSLLLLMQPRLRLVFVVVVVAIVAAAAFFVVADTAFASVGFCAFVFVAAAVAVSDAVMLLLLMLLFTFFRCFCPCCS